MNARVQWKDDEWKQIGKELYRRNPISTKSKSLTGIKEADVLSVMKVVVAENRWRHNINMTQTRPKLLEVFADIHREQDLLDQIKTRDQERESEDKTKADILTPLLDLFADQLFNRLRPLIDRYVEGRLLQTERYIGDTNIQLEDMCRTNQEGRQTKLKIGVIGLLPIQAHDIEKQFPDFNFAFVEDGNQTTKLKGKMAGTDVIFGLTTKMGHCPEEVLKSMNMWDKYKRVGGKGRSSVARSIQIWDSLRK